ncbi:MAG: adenosylmethionine decarboxylase [Patescibacteria group bacterium]|nr:adenosylmethionine decarboxylase [Patescibacteria group bacterium]MDE2144615.1 adenosylmethionine decarboxylase [Patescibacteria group bacterium]
MNRYQSPALKEDKQTTLEEHKPLGKHIIADFFDSENLDDLEFVKQTLTAAASAAKATILGSKFHKFSPQGVTGYLLLAESHISIHTWPEYGYAAIDVFTCGNMDPMPAFLLMKEEFKSKSFKTIEIMRGL